MKMIGRFKAGTDPSNGKPNLIMDPISTYKNLNDVKGDDAATKIASAIEESPVVVIGKSTCPFTIEARETFRAHGVPAVNYDVDNIAGGGTFLDALKTKYAPQKTVPFVFVGGALIGGCDATKAALASGDLDKKLRAAGVEARLAAAGAVFAQSAVLAGAKRASGPISHFPEILDDRVARWVGVYSFITCLLIAVFWNKRGAHWAMLCLLADFVLRFVGGANFSLGGSIASLTVAFMELFGSKPKWIAAPPKQFAALCGIMFSGLATLFFLVSPRGDGPHGHRDLRIVGLAFTCGLGGATALEGFVGFCMGCWMFGFLIKFGLVSPYIYQVFTNIKVETTAQWEEMNRRLHEAPLQAVHVPFDAEHPTQVDYKFQPKTDDQIREDFHMIKHVKISHFIMCMGLIGFADAYKLATPGLGVPAPVYYALGLFAAAVWFVITVLYLLKMLMYSNKVRKEWMSPVSKSAFVTPWVCVTLLSFLIESKSNPLAHVAYWIGAPMTFLLSIIVVGDWIANRSDLEHINAALMMAPLANFISALVGPTVSWRYRDHSTFFFAFAFVMMCVLTVVTFAKVMVVTDEDDRVRPFLGIWIAAFSVAAVSYAVCFKVSKADFVFTVLHFFSVSLVLVFIRAAQRPYFGRLKFDPSYWAAGFPTAALAFSSIQYHEYKQGRLAFSLAVGMLALTSFMHCILIAQTLAQILRRKFFVPDYKWAPLSFMRLTHEAFRGAMPRLEQAAAAIAEAGSDAKAVLAAVAKFESLWKEFSVLHHEHSKHEDNVLFKEYAGWFPGIADLAEKQHADHHQSMDAIAAAVSTIVQAGGKDSATAQTLVSLIDAYSKILIDHLRHEEDHMQGVPRRYIPISLGKKLVEKCWEETPAATWFHMLPFMINSIDYLPKRVRFLKTLLWAMPYRAQQFGLMLSLGVDAVQWKRITDELPELIPRGAAGWERFY